MNTFTLGACFQHELHTGPYFMTFAPRLLIFLTRDVFLRFVYQLNMCIFFLHFCFFSLVHNALCVLFYVENEREVVR